MPVALFAVNVPTIEMLPAVTVPLAVRPLAITALLATTVDDVDVPEIVIFPAPLILTLPETVNVLATTVGAVTVPVAFTLPVMSTFLLSANLSPDA